MVTYPSSRVTVRCASVRDVRTIARLDHQATQPPFDRSFYDVLLEGTGTDGLDFLEAAFTARASRWGQVEDFLLLEVDGQVAAGCAVFAPVRDDRQAGPLDPSLFPEIARTLGWSSDQTRRFQSAYAEMWKEPMAFLDYQADMVVEAVAVFPGFQGRRLGDRLMDAAKEYARRQGAKTLGVLVIHGNDKATKLYNRHFRPHVSFHADYFDDDFPGVTQFRATLQTGRPPGEVQ